MLAIIPALPSILASIVKVATTIGPMVAKYAPLLLEVAGKHLPQVIKTVETLSNVLNIISPNESAEELGAKVMSADKKSEGFEKINDYIDYLRKDVTVDKAALSTEKTDVMAREVIGTSLLIKGASEAIGAELTLPFIKTVSQLGVDAKLIIEVAKAYSNNGLSLDDYEKYIDKTLPIDQLDKHSDTLVSVYQKVDSNLSVEQAENAVMDLTIANSCD